MTRLPYENKPFDVVACCEVFEHFAEPSEAWLSALVWHKHSG
jgi:2-polyprenyl-3-methyl-5-hydroxy-6-metoxy-1,4-benzoquinol methylase